MATEIQNQLTLNPVLYTEAYMQWLNQENARLRYEIASMRVQMAQNNIRQPTLYAQPKIRYTTTIPKTTEDHFNKFIINGIEWIFQNPEKAFALAVGVATTVIVYKLITPK